MWRCPCILRCGFGLEAGSAEKTITEKYINYMNFNEYKVFSPRDNK
ncbi:hypothetical protein D083_2187 [Dickeya solani RNS 08.23.3.1.A]|nr:hypothetical protein D083_2187 [Dickeya solani RNS 08.23.3.1.A]